MLGYHFVEVCGSDLRYGNMFELDWVQIPDGEFIFGISDEQRTSLRRLIWTEYGIEQMDTQSRDIVARLADRYRRAGHGTVFERSALSKEERHIFPEFDDP